MHGVMSLDQMWAARPVFNYGDYKTPVKNLFICGSGTHPGGGVTGLQEKIHQEKFLKHKKTQDKPGFFRNNSTNLKQPLPKLLNQTQFY